ncbi:SCO4225 family membrane protein [Streptomyces minutiscleroticus]|uniref:Uncharacterized protein n=1 Tax=Streptomyces minutiscleroticus TaxID=68238 RepID=A0A918NU74_9ACTN|nr:hypothetical protein [Streptomyces minutiscleroticus]GGX96582.1 hypothetical protein GCM10010358_58010 [Streptomyces minutiscleroticus]
MAASSRSLTTAFRHCLLNPVALGYLALVAAVWVWIGVDLLFVDHQDASFAAVWGFLVTAPASLLFLTLPGPAVWAGVAVAAVVQAAVLGAAYRGFAGRLRHRAGTV